ncbi:MAG: NAD(P)/FAD-dependent oxidoreductase [Gammaproteobacteria bacterium]|nr:NAD(P)/FAD-dependent oxidoreductase [Gammaproteobacteria bacterium]
MISKLRYGLHAFVSTKIKNWQHLDEQEASVWIRRWIGKRAYEVFWQRLFALKFFEYKDNLSAAWIWSRIKRVGVSRKSLMQEQMGYLEGGSQTLLDEFGKAISALGGKFNLKTAVRQLSIKNNALDVLRTDVDSRHYDAVFSTIPLPLVADIIPALPDEYKQKYRSVQNMGVVCVILQMKKPVSDNFWLNISDEAIDIPGIIEFSNLRPLGTHVVYVPYYMPQTHAKHDMSNDEFIAEAQSYIKKLNPDLADDDFSHAHVSRYAFAQPICPPGFLKKLPPIETDIKGLYIADTSYYYPEDRSISESVRLGQKMAAMYRG